MKKFIKNNIVGFLLGAVIFSGITVYAGIKLKSEEVSYNDGTVKEALDTLYQNTEGLQGIKKFCKLVSGEKEAIGSKYECDPGDGIKRNFYVLSVGSQTVDLIMEKNLTETVGSAKTITWYDAMKFFRTGAGVSIKNSWTNIMAIDLPKAQAIADAVGNTSFVASDSAPTWWCFGSYKQDVSGYPKCTNSNQSTHAWIFNYLSGCTTGGCTVEGDVEASGYWMRDLIANSDDAWHVAYTGVLHRGTVTYSAYHGVRPVITVLKSNLYK